MATKKTEELKLKNGNSAQADQYARMLAGENGNSAQANEYARMLAGEKTQTGNAKGQSSGTSYTGLEGVSSNTAAQTGRYQQGYTQSDSVNNAQSRMEQSQNYTQSDAVTAAQRRLSDLDNNRPGAYQSRYSQQLDDVLQRISNPGDFKYEFNGDSLFNQYADMYQQRGRQASMDAQGQAAALTGGYGNSYGQMVGTQAYQQYLTQLYDKGLEFRDRAYQQYQDALANDRNLYGILAQQDQTDYGRYRDTMGDWENERNYLTNRYDTERNFDYNQYLSDRDYYTNLYNTERNFDYTDYTNNRDYWTGLAQVENRDYRSEQERQEAIRQYEQNFAYQQQQDDKQYAYNYCMRIIGNGQMPSEELLREAGLSRADAQAMIAQQAVATGGGGGGGRRTTSTGTSDPSAGAFANYAASHPQSNDTVYVTNVTGSVNRTNDAENRRKKDSKK